MLVFGPDELGIRQAGGWVSVMVNRREFVRLLARVDEVIE